MLNVKNLDYIRSKDPKIAESFNDLAASLFHTMKNINVTPDGNTLPPPSVSAVQAIAAQGIFDVAITDNSSAVSRGINYFVEYSTSPQFNAPHVIDLGASRNWRGFLGNRVFYFRAYSSYPTSPRSAPTYFGSQTAPIAVQGGGTSTGPDPLPSCGSGTSNGASGSDGGFGNAQTRS